MVISKTLILLLRFVLIFQYAHPIFFYSLYTPILCIYFYLLQISSNPSLHLQSVPIDVLEDYNLTSMTLEYRRECHQSNVLESLTTVAPKMSEDSNNFTDKTGQELESTHLLRMQADKAEIVRARSVWQSKHKHMI